MSQSTVVELLYLDSFEEGVEDHLHVCDEHVLEIMLSVLTVDCFPHR